MLPYIRAADVWLIGHVYPNITPLRRIYDHELVYVLAGEADITLGNHKLRLQADNLFLVQPGVWHSYASTSEEKVALLGVHFDWQYQVDHLHYIECITLFANVVPDETLWREPRNISGWDLDERPALNLAGRPRARRILEQVVAAQALENEFSAQQAAALLAAAIYQIAQEVRLLSGFNNSHAVGPATLRLMSSARELLETPGPLNKYRSVEEVAAAVGWSPDHLRRVCRTVLESSPTEVQTAARIRRARTLLKTGMSINEVSYQCGFDDPAYFSRVFKKLTAGQSPRLYAAKERLP